MTPRKHIQSFLTRELHAGQTMGWDDMTDKPISAEFFRNFGVGVWYITVGAFLSPEPENYTTRWSSAISTLIMSHPRLPLSDEETSCLTHSPALWLHVHRRGSVCVRHGRLQCHTGPTLQAGWSRRLPNSHSAQKLPLWPCGGLRWIQSRPTIGRIHQPEQRRTHGWTLQVQDPCIVSSLAFYLIPFLFIYVI